MTENGWFVGVDSDDTAEAVAHIREGSADAPADWPAQAVDAGFAADEESYYERLHAVTVEAARQEVVEKERATDKQLIHAVRAMDDARRMANELAERVAEWAGSRFADAGTGVESARKLAEREPKDAADERLIALATRCAELDDEANALKEFVEETTPLVAPNLSNLAEPVLAARLIALAGGLDTLAKKPSGTVQVLGAEDALFAHLKGQASSPKHGIIFMHPAIRHTRREDRGSAARALAGKLTIAARIDHYAGDLRPELKDELDERIATIQARGEN
ncbi:MULTISPECIES: NOP5/NOP56 family protein [unclassified Haladaptatus]|uniref:NOP5/NOP56 family protein n=1 Tax=unclassified Haladaptatus TaxID=2622732 RepID=UPI0023E861A5|nr:MULTISPECIES: NOP5/NOP56 family protein [unclassified Haladaptatus]